MDTEDTLPTFLYAAVVLMTLGLGGGAAEFCGELAPGFRCSDRAIVFIVFSFLIFIPAVLLLGIYIFDIIVFKKAAVFISPVAVLFSVVATAIATSTQTKEATTSTILLSWLILLSSVAGLILELKKALSPTITTDVEKDTTMPLTGGIPQMTAAPYQPVPTQTVVGTPYQAPPMTQAQPVPGVIVTAPPEGAKS